MDFYDVISDKIADFSQERNEKQADLLNPEYHREQLKEALHAVALQLADVSEKEDKDFLLKQSLSVLSQIPDFATSIWSSLISDIKGLDAQVKKWEEMRELYVRWQKQQAAAAAALEDAKTKISKGEIKEPTRQSSRDRDVGDHPGISISSYRRAASQLEEGEESEE